jgi:RecA/RadA recombinase
MSVYQKGMIMSFLNNIIKASGNEYASTVDDGLEFSDVKDYVDTGSHTFNALLSGSLYGGIPDNKIIALAGETSTGKTYFSMGIVKKFLDTRKDGYVLYFDSEQAITSDMFKSRGIDPKRVGVFPVTTVEEFRKQVISMVDSYLALGKKEQKPLMIVLDSLGMLSTEKEMNDSSEGKNVRDMTRAQVIKSVFRVLTIKLGMAHIPLIMTNHTYDIIGAYVPMKKMGGGSGLEYAASMIVFLTKKKERVGDEVVGNVIHCRLTKGRFTKENKMVDVLLKYDTGLDPYYGLTDIAMKSGIFKKVSTKIELPDGTTVFEKHINENPQKYFTPEVMKLLEEAVAKEFKYGTMNDSSEPVQESDE